MLDFLDFVAAVAGAAALTTSAVEAAAAGVASIVAACAPSAWTLVTGYVAPTVYDWGAATKLELGIAKKLEDCWGTGAEA